MKASLITSFSVLGFEDALANWPQDLPYAELYAFFRNDFRVFCKNIKSIQKILHEHVETESALCLMSRLGSSDGNDPAIGDLAKYIYEIFSEKKISVIGLATFLPGLSDGINSTPWQALRFILKLTVELKKIGCNIKVIELVGGGVAHSGFSDLRLKDDKSTAVVMLDTDEFVISNLLTTLTQICELDEFKAAAVKFAIELEPGPFYAIRDVKTLLLFKKILQEKHSQLIGLVGLNLDIAHWNLAGISTEFYGDTFKSLIFHSHASDHGIGHFGDAALGSINQPTTWLHPWLKVLSNLESTCYSGFCSVEIEAAKNVKQVHNSCELLLTAINQVLHAEKDALGDKLPR